MTRPSSFVLFALAGAASLGLCGAARADIAFGFDGNSIGQATPFTNTVSGLSATFAGTGASVTSGSIYGDPNNVLAPSSDPIDITFSAPIDNINTVFYGVRGSTVTLTAYNGGVSVGSVNAIVPGLGQGNHPALDFLSFSGPVFNEITLTNYVALNDVFTKTAVPEPRGASALVFGVLSVAMLAMRRRRMSAF